MDQEPRLTPDEEVTTTVYGDTFALYSDQEFDEFMVPLRERLAVNSITADAFRGKRCLDAGCGGGRGSVFMAEAGAAELIGIDLSERNIETCRMRAAQRRLAQCTFHLGSLLEVPFPDESFDVVWCNGVLHHTDDPDKALQEVTRVLKPGGSMWLYLYGSGGIYWYMVDWVRALLAGVDVRECISDLRLSGAPVRRIAEWIDDWFAAYVRRYRAEGVRLRLGELGFEGAQALARGTGYDTSQRRIGTPAVERELMGDGDIRFFATKTGRPSGRHEHVLPDPPDRRGSPYDDAPIVTDFAAPLARVADAVRRLEQERGITNGVYRIMAASSVHSKVRSLHEADAPFDTAELHRHLDELVAIIATFPRLSL